MSNARTGGAAFPTPIFQDEQMVGSTEGMSLRDYFAGQVVAGLVASDRDMTQWDKATYAYELADQLIRARQR